jgi:hypothetical protein
VPCQPKGDAQLIGTALIAPRHGTEALHEMPVCHAGRGA